MGSEAPKAIGPEISLGRALGGSIGLLASNPVTVFTIAFLFSAVPGAAWGFQYGLVLSGGYGVVGRSSSILVLVVSGILAFAVYQLAQGALFQLAAARRDGRRTGFGEAVEVGFRAALPMMGRAVLAGVATALAAVALIVPAILLYVIWTVSAPALVLERLNVTEALERSQALTRGARWQVLAFQLVLLATSWGLNLLPRALLRISDDWIGTTASTCAAVVIGTFVTAFSAVAHAMLFFELRDWKEGPPTDRLAEIFG